MPMIDSKLNPPQKEMYKLLLDPGPAGYYKAIYSYRARRLPSESGTPNPGPRPSELSRANLGPVIYVNRPDPDAIETMDCKVSSCYLTGNSTLQK